MSTVTPTSTPITLQDALRFYQGDISNNPEFNSYWQLYGDPPDQQSWWIDPSTNQLTPQGADYLDAQRADANVVSIHRAAAPQAA